MSVSFDIQSSTGRYGIVVKTGSFSEVLANQPQMAVIADDYFLSRLQRAGVNAITVNAAETVKSLDGVVPIIQEMRSRGVGRYTELVSVGGGIVQDVSTFVASIYMRGLQWQYVPTTLLSMVDSCIGGKSSINVGPYKNLVGTFHPPKKIAIDPELVSTLSVEQRISGLMEAAKICFCRGPEAFARYMSYNPGPVMPSNVLEQVIVCSLEAKKWFIEIDEFDKAERLLLNFGHTFGHAVEGASHFQISHGIAVGIGILCALEFERLGGVDYSRLSRVQEFSDHLNKLLRGVPELQKQLRALPLNEVMERFESDKKHGPEHYTLVLVSAQGDVVLRRLDKSQPIRNRLEAALRNLVEKNGR